MLDKSRRFYLLFNREGSSLEVKTEGARMGKCAMIRSQTWPCPCPRLISRLSKSCSPRRGFSCANGRAKEKDGANQREKRAIDATEKWSCVQIGT